MAKISRRRIAQFWADELLLGHDITARIAAYLVETKRVREADLIVRDTEIALAERGVVVADVASAQSLSPKSRQVITDFLRQSFDADTLSLRETTDESLLGGASIDVAGERLDMSVRTRLNQLKSSKI